MKSKLMQRIFCGCLLFVGSLVIHSNADAVSCSLPNNPDYGANLGFQYVAQACASGGKFIYNRFDLNCNQSSLVEGLNLSTGSTPRTPDEMQTALINYYNSMVSQGYLPASYRDTLKVFRNSTGSSFVLVVDSYSKYHQSIDGKDMGSSSYAYWPTFNQVDFGIFNYPTGQTPPCCVSASPPSVATTIKPTVGEVATITPILSSNYPINWQLTVNGTTTSGSGSAPNITWPGKDANGNPLPPGTYPASVTASSTGCTDASTSFSVTVTEPPNSSVEYCGFGSEANLAGGRLTHTDEIISVNGGLLPLSLSIDYNSQDSSSGSLGPYWRHSLDISLTATAAGDGSLMFREGGTKRVYTYSGGVFNAPAGDYGTLTNGAGGTHDLTYRSGLAYHFLSDGKIDTITDRYSNQLKFDYVSGDLSTVTDSSGQKLTFTYDTPSPPHWLQSVTDPKNNSFTFVPQSSKLWKVVNPVANTDNAATYFEYLYNATTGLLDSRRDPDNNLTQYTFETDATTGTKRVHTSIDPDGVTNPQNHTRTVGYNSSTKTTTFTEKDGGTWTYKYDTAKGTLTSVKNVDTNIQTDYYYDPSGNLKAITVPYDGSTKYTTFYTYDNYGNLKTETDPVDISGYPSLQGIDLSTVTPTTLAGLSPPITPAMTYDWDATDRITQISNVRDTTALTTTVTYETEAVSGLELTTVTDPELKTTKIRRNPTSGQIRQIEDGNEKITYFEYYQIVQNDPNSGQLQYIKGPDDVKTTFGSYDWNGNPGTVQVTDKNNATIPVDTTLGYDALNRLRSLTQSLTVQGKTLTSSYDYDQYGTLTVKDPEQNATQGSTGTRYIFNYNKRVKQVTDALTGVTVLTYGGQGCASCGGVDQLTAVKDPRQYAKGAQGKSTLFLYDKLGRLQKETDPLGKVMRYTYFDNGLLRGKYDATGGDPGALLVSYTYNNRGQLLTKTRSNGDYDQYTYKTNAFLDTATTKVKNPDSSFSTLISYSLDWYKNGWLKSVTDITAGLPGTPLVSYDLYDNDGQRKTVTYFKNGTDQRVLTYDYDTANRPWHIYDDMGTAGNTADDKTFTYDYDARGRRWHLTYPNPVAAKQIVATYGYDDLDQLTSLSHMTVGGTDIASFTYPLYDKAGNRKSKSVTGSDPTAETYVYDTLYRIYQTITPGGTEEFHYDTANNRTSGPGPMDTRYEIDPDANLMKKGRLYDYVYDNRGNQTTRTVPAEPSKSWIQVWDSENRLTSVVKTKGTEIRTVTFAYDPFGRRIGKTFTLARGATTLISNSWQYVYDNEDIFFESYAELNKPMEKTFFIHGPDIDEPLALARGGQYYTYHADGLGSIAVIVDQNSTVAEHYTYDSYGMVTPSTGFRNSYTYTGREWDKEAGLLYYRLRYRDPLDGNFVGKDSLGFAAGDINLWNYVGANPINWIDPSGLEPYKDYGKKGGPSDVSNEIIRKAEEFYKKGGKEARDAAREMIKKEIEDQQKQLAKACGKARTKILNNLAALYAYLKTGFRAMPFIIVIIDPNTGMPVGMPGQGPNEL